MQEATAKDALSRPSEAVQEMDASLSEQMRLFRSGSERKHDEQKRNLIRGLLIAYALQLIVLLGDAATMLSIAL